MHQGDEALDIDVEALENLDQLRLSDINYKSRKHSDKMKNSVADLNDLHNMNSEHRIDAKSTENVTENKLYNKD